MEYSVCGSEKYKYLDACATGVLLIHSHCHLLCFRLPLFQNVPDVELSCEGRERQEIRLLYHPWFHSQTIQIHLAATQNKYVQLPNEHLQSYSLTIS